MKILIRFNKSVPITNIACSQYNPREITDESFALLQESLRLFGIVKPLIVNSENNVIIAGHQRKKAAEAIGYESVPCVYVKSPSLEDELIFNLVHNSIETSDCVITVSGFKVGDYQYIERENIHLEERAEKVQKLVGISKLLSQYGEWGSVVCDEDGKLLLNSEYAMAAYSMGYGVLAYCIPNDKRELFLKYISNEYGRYCFDKLPIKTYHQFQAQPKRNSVSGRKKNTSILYTEYIIPSITKNTRVVDVGAGRFAYVNELKSKGYKICGYEPAFVSGHSINVRAIISHILTLEKDIKSNGLFDVCVLEAVINSVESDTFEDIVLTTCNSLLKQNGVLVTCTRNIRAVEVGEDLKKCHGRKSSGIYYLDYEGYSVSVKEGLVYKQKFHSTDSYKSLLERYFEQVDVVDVTAGYIYCIAKRPKRLAYDKVESSISEEFNIEYPGGFKHNKHEGLVSAIMQEVKKRNGENG